MIMVIVITKKMKGSKVNAVLLNKLTKRYMAFIVQFFMNFLDFRKPRIKSTVSQIQITRKI